MTEATAGALTGAGEVVLLPLDVLKIKRQCVDPLFSSPGERRLIGRWEQNEPGGVPVSRVPADHRRRRLLALPGYRLDGRAQRSRVLCRPSMLLLASLTDRC